jgi:hypothetical protein
MKTLKLVSIAIVLFLITATTAQAQVSINVGVNPSWGLSGYSGIRYYYLPDIEAYYDIQMSRFIYNEGGIWVHRSYLPARYRNYNLRSGYKVVLRDYRGDAPYIHHDDFRRTYVRGYHGTEREYYFNRSNRGNDRRVESNIHRENDRRIESNIHRENDRRIESNIHRDNGRPAVIDNHRDNGHSVVVKDNHRDNGRSSDRKDDRGHNNEREHR